MADPYAGFEMLDGNSDPYAGFEFIDQPNPEMIPPPPAEAGLLAEPLQSTWDGIGRPAPPAPPPEQPGAKLARMVQELEALPEDSDYAKYLRGRRRLDYVTDRVPFMGAALGATKQMNAKQAFDAIREGTADDAAYGIAAEYIDEQRRSGDRGVLRQAVDLATAIPGFAVEYSLTGGAYSGAKAAAGKALGQGLAGQVASRAAGVAAQTAMNPTQIARSTASQAMPDVTTVVDESGKPVDYAIGQSSDFLSSLPAGFADAAIEVASERAGAGLAKATGLAAIQKAATARWLSKPGRTTAMLQEAIKQGGQDGVIGEMLEERVGELARIAIGIEEGDQTVAGKLILSAFLSDPKKRSQLQQQALEQLTVEGLAFAAPGAISAASRALPQREVQQPDYDLQARAGDIERQYREEQAAKQQPPSPQPQQQPTKQDAGSLMPQGTAEERYDEWAASQQPKRTTPADLAAQEAAVQQQDPTFTEQSDQELGTLLAEIDEQLDEMDLEDPQYDALDIRRQLVSAEIKKRLGKDVFTRPGVRDNVSQTGTMEHAIAGSTPVSTESEVSNEELVSTTPLIETEQSIPGGIYTPGDENAELPEKPPTISDKPSISSQTEKTEPQAESSPEVVTQPDVAISEQSDKEPVDPRIEAAAARLTESMRKRSMEREQDRTRWEGMTPAEQQELIDRAMGMNRKWASDLVQAIDTKNIERLKVINNGLNPDSKAVFEEVTGLKMGKSQKDGNEVLRQYVGPEAWDKWHADRQAKREADEREREEKRNQQEIDAAVSKQIRWRPARPKAEVKSGESPLGEPRVTTIREYLDYHIEQGDTLKDMGKRGIRNVWALENAEGWTTELRNKHELAYVQKKLAERDKQPEPSKQAASDNPPADDPIANPAAFKKLSTEHFKFHYQLERLQSAGILDGDDMAIMRAIFAESDIKKFADTTMRPVDSMTDQAGNILYGATARVARLYNPETKKTVGHAMEVMRKFPSGVPDNVSVILHELGHVAWTYLTPEQRAEFKRDISADRSQILRIMYSRHGDAVAEHFASDHEEAFAQLFADAMLERRTAAQDPPVVAKWLRKIIEIVKRIFSGLEPRLSPAQEAKLNTILDAAIGYTKPKRDTLSQPTRDYGTIDKPNRVALGKHFGDRLASGAAYDTISDARKEASGLLGGDVKPGTLAAKHVDEAVEQGVVRAARDILSQTPDRKVAYDALVDLYQRQPNLAVRTSTSMQQQAYSTPAPLALLASRLAGIDSETRVLEPTAGNGMLLIEADPSNAVANELNSERANALEAMGFTPSRIDATDLPTMEPVDAVIANPPFGKVQDADGKDKVWVVDGVTTNNVDHAIALSSLQSLKPDGKAVLILGAKGGRETDPVKRAKSYSGAGKTFYDKLYDTYNVTDHFTVSGDLYQRQGAGFPVDVIVISGKGGQSRPKPWNVKADAVPKVYESWEDLKNDKLVEPRVESGGGRPGSSRPGGRTGTDVGSVPQPPANAPAANEPRRPTATPEVSTGVVESDGGGGGKRRPGKPRPERPVPGDAGERPQPAAEQLPEEDSGRSGDRGGDGDARPGDVDDGSAAEPKVARKPSSATSNEYQVPYAPKSQLEGVDTLLPRNHVDAVSRALDSIEERYGDIDKFVAKELGFNPKTLADRFSAEQIDAIAMAIANHKSGEGFIIGDQTGVGKGRAAAAMIRYAQRQKLLPVFVTEKPDLYGDMVRDLGDIGVSTIAQPFNILATNDLSAEKKVLLPDGRELAQSAAVAKRIVPEAIDNWLAGKGLTAKMRGKDVTYDAVFTTYSQMQTVKGAEPWRRLALRKAKDRAFFILDESHNAGGTSTDDSREASDAAPSRADFVRELITEAPGVYYSSATFAKRPEVMDLYARAGMGRAVENPSDLPKAIAAGKVPLQQVVSEMLAEAGQYLRRERSYDGVEFGSKIVDVDLQKADKVTEVFRAIQKFDKAKAQAVKDLEDDVVSDGGKIGDDSSTGQRGIDSTNFTSILWNIVDQQLMALKADAAAQDAIDAAKRGETPVIAIDNTMESALGHYLEANPVTGDGPVNFTFAALLDRYLERTREVIIKADRSDPKSWKRHRLTDEELGPAGVAMYDAAKALIEAFDVEIPASPIDWIRYRLEKAGLKVAEITGRKQGLRYFSDKMSQSTLWTRPDEELGTAGKARTIAGINSGKLDVVILNRSGATGVSLHASAKFKNQKPRRMIIAQAAKNIDEFMQVLGRVHRTGQVKLPKYTLLLSNAPAENRPASVLVKKLSSLNANVTGSASGAVGFEAPDILNEVGDEVVAAYLNDNRSIWEELDEPLEESHGTIQPTEGAARKVSGRVALLPVEDQEHFWEEVSRMYAQKIEELDNLGDNPLVAKTLPLAAKTLERFPVFDGVEESANPFEQPAYLEKVSAKKVGKPFSSAEVEGRIKEFFGIESAEPMAVFRAKQEWINKFRSELRDRMQPFASQKVADAKTPERAAELREQFQDQFAAIVQMATEYSPGTPVTVSAWFGEMPGVVTGFRQQGKSKNPAAPSTWMADIAVADSVRRVSVPVSQLSVPGQTYIQNRGERLADVIPQFDEAATTAREERFIATGNLLAAYTTLKEDKARIVFFTDDQGQTRRGILMPAKFDPQEWQEKRPVAFEDAALAMKFLDKGGMLWAPDKTAWVTTAGGQLIVKAVKARSKGGKYTTNGKILKAASPDEFISKGGYMELVVPKAKAKDVLTAMLSVSALQATEAKGIARDILSQAGVSTVLKAADVAEEEADRPASYGFFGAATMPRQIDDRIAPKSIQADNQDVEQQLQDAYGSKPEKFIDKLKGASTFTANAATRSQQHIPTDAQHATMNEMFRLQKQQANTAQDEANRRIAAIVHNLGPQQLQLFTRKAILDNLLASIDRGEPLRFGFESRDEVVAYKTKLDALADATPNVVEAIKARQTVVTDLVTQLVEAGLLPESALERSGTYYHQQVLSYLGASRMGRNPQITKKGFQKKRVEGVAQFDESLNYNTSYIEAESAWMADAFHQLAKEKWVRDLGQRFDIKKQLQEFAKQAEIDWRDLVRESKTHRIWQAKPGNVFYQALGVAEKTVEKVLLGLEDTAEVHREDLRNFLAIGGPQREMVLPNELVDQLESMKAPKGSDGTFGAGIEWLSKQILKAWKTWILFSPLRSIPYFLRNQIGDLDAGLGGAVHSYRYYNRAMGELARYYGVAKPTLNMSPELKEARDLAVIDSSMTASEVPDLKDLAVFRRFFTSDRGELARHVKNYFATVKRFNAFREAVSRYAAFLYYRDALNRGSLAHYGGARKEIVDALAAEMGTDVAAAHLARNLLGDYGDLTVMGNFLREHAIPFYSWTEVNTKRYPMMFYNALAFGARAAPNDPAKAAAYTAGSLGMALLPYVAMQLYNHLVWPDEEDKLSDDERASPHLILGKTPEGNIRILRNTGALGDFLEMFGVNTAVARLDELKAGQMSYKALAAEIGRDVSNKFIQGMRPDLKAFYEIPTGQSIYPNMFTPRPVRRDEQFASYLGLQDAYREGKGRVTQSGLRARPNAIDRALIGISDPRRTALFEILDLRGRFLESVGGRAGGGAPGKLRPYLDNMRDAAASGDETAFREARQVFRQNGGKFEQFKNAIKGLDPLNQRLNDKQEWQFVNEYLTHDQREKLARARDYARDLEVKMWSMWHATDASQ